MDYDLIVVGAGVVGLTFAAAVSALPLKIAVIERKPCQIDWSLDDLPYQVSAIMPAAEFAFRRLNVWPAIVARRLTAFDRTFVWDGLGMGQIKFTAAELGLPYLGHIIENNVLVAALMEHCEKKDNIAFYVNTDIKAFSTIDDKIMLHTDSTCLTASLAVAADGAHSWLRQQVGIEREVKPYQQSAIVTTVATELPHESTAWQCFLSTGPLACLPLTSMPDHEHLASVVWSTTPEKADELVGMDTFGFEQELASAFQYRLGSVKALGPRMALPLVMRHADTYSMNQVVLIGDAAHTIHPLAGQGMNLGILDACELAEAIKIGLQQGRPLYSQKILSHYERSRRTENQTMVLVMQGLNSLFSRDGQVLPSVRSVGLALVDRCRPLKHILLRQAMGLLGSMPPLAKVDPSIWLTESQQNS